MRISARGKEWRLLKDTQADEQLVKSADGSVLLAKILLQRGVQSAQEAQAFLNHDSYTPASPVELMGMADAVARINLTITNNENITVYGDYDVDGVTATSVLVSTLRLLGAQVDYYIPHRTEEGYGLNLKAVSILASKRRTKLIITCDCGISNFAEINFAKSLGLDTIVVDHHTMPDLLPPAIAILHPKQLDEEHPLYHLPGVGVAYKLCEALFLNKDMPEQIDKLLDFVTLGMIADLVPLIKENRYLVQIGLPKLIDSPRPGIRALLAQVKNNGGTDVVGFGLAPRINAVGRLAEATKAVELMITQDNEQAEKLANQLQNENAKRQELCERILLEADQMVTSKIDLTKNRAIVIYKQGWHHGVVGIVASRLVEKYHCPVFIGELDETSTVIKGSARGVEGIDLFQVLKANEQLMTRWGGHKMAAGFSLEANNGETFVQAITGTCNKMLADANPHPVLQIDSQVEAKELSLELVQTLSRLAPFGMANKKPVLFMENIFSLQSKVLGKDNKHSRITLGYPPEQNANMQFESVFWNSKGFIPPDNVAIDIAFTPEINSYNNRDRLQLVLVDWRVSNEQSNNYQPNNEQSGQVQEAAVVPQEEKINNEEEAVKSAENVVEDLATNATAEALPQTNRNGLFSTNSLSWKDLREHNEPTEVVLTAVRKLSENIAIFAESCAKIPTINFIDRTVKNNYNHLLIWQYPPSLQILRDLLINTGAKNVYLVGGAQQSTEEPVSVIKKLLGLVRFVINQKEGKVEGEKLAVALGTSKMVVALGLTILKKVTMIDWFAEEGIIYLDLLDQSTGLPEDVPEYRQLSECLRELNEFRLWCADASLKDLQLAIAPNHVKLVDTVERRQEESEQYQNPAEFSNNR